MSCARWQELLTVDSVDDMEAGRRRDFLAHLQGCASCRRLAAEADPTLIFSLLPAAAVDDQEVEEIRRSVQTLRRVRALEASWSRPGRWGLAAAAVAAVALLTLVALPSKDPGTTEIPFAGAVGVGSGVVSVPESAAFTQPVDLQLELARSPQLVELAGTSRLERLAQRRLVARPGVPVVETLGEDFQIRLLMESDSAAVAGWSLGLGLARLSETDTGPLFEARLEPQPDSPLVVGVPTKNPAAQQLWIRLTWTTGEAVRR